MFYLQNKFQCLISKHCGETYMTWECIITLLQHNCMLCITSCSGSDTCGARTCIYNTHRHKFINIASVNIIMISATFPPVNQSTHHFMRSCTVSLVDCLHMDSYESPPLVTWKTFITPAHSLSETNKQKQLFIHVLTASCLIIMHCKSTQLMITY